MLPSSPPQEFRLPRTWYRLLFYFLKQVPRRSFGLALASCLPRFFDVLVVYATKNIIDTVLKIQSAPTVSFTQETLKPLVFFVCVILGRFAGDLIIWTLSYNTKFSLLRNMRTEIFAYVQRHATTYFDAELSGRVAHKTVLIPEQLVLIYERCAFDFVPATSFFLVIAAFFCAESPVFALVVMAYILIYFFLCFKQGFRIAPFARARNAASTHVTGRVADVITNIKNVIFMSAENYEDSNVGKYVLEEKDKRQLLYRAIVRLRLMQRGLDITMWIVLYVGAIYAWYQHIITAGGFVMITTLSGMLLKTAYDVGQIFPEFFDVIGSAQDGIDTILVPHTMRDSPGALTLEVTQGVISFADITFAYENNRKVFDHFSLHIPSGQRVGLIGASGAGKTTLASMLLRLHDPHQGKILIDEQNVADVTQASLRGQIGLIPQDTMLFHRSLMENIRYGRQDATDTEVIEAARRAFADDFIQHLPEKYKTMVGERGVKLSGGQRQRIAIARALLKNAPILILDEATSALDSESEAVIHQAMTDAMKGRTVIAIAHRLSTIAHLDRLIVLKDGKIIEDGSHQKLLALDGFYARLWQTQSGGFLSEGGEKNAFDQEMEDMDAIIFNREQENDTN